MFTAAHLRMFLRALCNLDPYTFTDEVVEHFAGGDENRQKTPEEILAVALAEVPDEKLTSFALRLALTGFIDIPRESDCDFLKEAESAIILPRLGNEKKARKVPTLIKATPKKRSISKTVAA
jgi:ParB family chromosome partitioning protein